MIRNKKLKSLKVEKEYNKNGKITLEVLEFAQNYNRWIASHLLPYIVSPALEIGAGSGNITQLILPVRLLHLSELDKTLLIELKNKFRSKIRGQIHKLDIENEILPKFRNYFSSIYAINVLEHIHNDKEALIHINTMLRPDGRVVILVPAKQFAYSRLDKELGHYRRYEKKDLVYLLQQTGFYIEKINYFNIVGLLSWYIRDKIDADHTQLKPYQIKLFEGIVPFLRLVESKIRIPVGISLIVIGRKHSEK